VQALSQAGAGFLLTTSAGVFAARSVALATGGRSLPKSGSDGAGYDMARTLGHTIVATTPALAPLVLAADPPALHAAIPGVSLDAILTLWLDGAAATKLRGSLLWTHFGISGPVVLDMSRHWLRARVEGRAPALTASFVPGKDFQAVERFWLDEREARPRATVGSTLARLLPASMAAALPRALGIGADLVLAQLAREPRRRLARALTEWPLPVVDSRGYNHAEATAGGVDLREIDPATMQSRRCAGLYLVGEILDVDGRLGGFNFQWAWSSAYVAGRALARNG
jgi:predicted Rossmann fold flavoprotein